MFSVEQNIESPSLCFDNWVAIASHLDLYGLANLVNVCQDARHAVRFLFKLKYASPSTYNSTYLQMNVYGVIRLTFSSGDETLCSKRSKSLRFLRNFGDLITELKLFMSNNPILNNNCVQKFIEHINKFSEQSHKTLIVNDYLPILIEHPLRNVDKIEVFSAKYPLGDFNALIKNVSYMKIWSDNARIYLNQHMPALQIIEIDTENYNEVRKIGDKHILQIKQLNPQIQTLIIKCQFFNLNVSGAEIDIEIWESHKSSSVTIICPKQFKKMYLQDHTCDDISLNRFINLVHLSIVLSFSDHVYEIHRLPKLEILQICCSLKITDATFDRILSSAEAHRKLSILSFHFYHPNHRQAFGQTHNQRIYMEKWLFTLNETGPKEYKYSIVLNRIRSE